MSGPTGPIQKLDFEELITFDEALNFRVEPRWLEQIGRLIHIHYFKNGVEVGYWCPITSFGFIFETPRIWHPSFKARLSAI